MRYLPAVLALAAFITVTACAQQPAATTADAESPIDDAPLTNDGGGLPGSPIYDPLEVLRRAEAAGGLTSLSPSNATAIIDSYISALGQRAGSEAIVGELRSLREALTAEPIDGAKVGELLRSLGRRTTAAAEDDSSYGILGKALMEAGEGM